MPLKHRSETLLFFVLAASIALFGVALGVIPSPRSALAPFTLLFVLSMLYPLALQSYLRIHRADYELRVLHYYPVAMVLLFGLLDRLSSFHAIFLMLFRGVFLLSALPLVVLAYFLLAYFAVHVLRRFVVRLSGLLVLFSLYLALLFTPSSVAFLADVQNILHSPELSHRILEAPVRTAHFVTSLFRGLFLAPEQVTQQHTTSSSHTSFSLRSSRPSSLAHSGPTEGIVFFVFLFFVFYSAVLHRRFMKMV